jgi:TonB-linked SusC/RagA family outer membrane protein
MGYKSQRKEITVLAEQEVVADFVLKVDVLRLNEVVVTGMGGTMIKEKLGVTIDKVEPTLVQEADQSNVVSALSGKIVNVEITKTSGMAGTGSFIRIRGGNSIDRDTQPLFVVDGVPISNRADYTLGLNGGVETANRASDINVEDIESIDVLKGSAASAIFGSRASNGVVMITTKSGKPGATKISYKMSYSYDEVNNSYPLQTKYGQGTNGEYRKNYSRTWGPLLESDVPVYDHWGEILEPGYTFDNNVTISGGNDLTTFFLSFGRNFEKGPIKGNSDYERYTARVKASQVITEKLKLTGNIAYVNTNANYVQRGDNARGLMIAALRSPPDFNNLPYIHPETGYHRSFRYVDATELRRTRGFDNPFFVMHEHVNTSDVDRVYGNIKLEYDPFDWLNISNTIGSDYSIDARLMVYPPSTSAYYNGRMRVIDFMYHETDNNLVATIQAEKWLQKLSKNISGTFMLGHNLNSRSYHRNENEGNDMGVYGWNQLDNCVVITPDEYEWLIHTESYFGQMTLDLFDQLYLTGALRNDGSSTFGLNKRHWYPKASAAWEFTKLKQLPKIPLLDFGKVRFAYCVTGLQPGVYTTSSGFITGDRVDGMWSSWLTSTYNGVQGYYHSNNRGKIDIKPEKSREYEMGINLGLWDSRIGLDVTYYNTRSTDVIFDLNVVPSTGAFSGEANAATIENKGWELSLDVMPIKKPNFEWITTLLWARNRNMVVDMSGAEWESFGGKTYAAEGRPLGSFYGRSFVRFGYGIIIDGVDIDAAYPEAKPGDVYISDTGYPILDTELRWSGNHVNPDWTGSVRNEFRVFKNWQFSVLFDIRNGSTIQNTTRGVLYNYGTHKDTETRGEMHVFEGYGPGKGTEVPLDEDYYRTLGGYFSGDEIILQEDGGFVKLREIALSYTMKNNFIKKFGLSDVNIRLSGRNLVTWTDYTGLDPETNRSQMGSSRNYDYFNQPQSRSYVLTLRVNY